MRRHSKTAASYRISQNVKYHNTAPELVVRSLLDELGVHWKKYAKVHVKDPKDGDEFDFEPDLMLDDGRVILVQGKYHETEIQGGKTRWECRLYNLFGHPVILASARDTVNQKLKDYLKAELLKAINAPPIPVTTIPP